jgi:hypothetical protein
MSSAFTSGAAASPLGGFDEDADAGAAVCASRATLGKQAAERMSA